MSKKMTDEAQTVLFRKLGERTVKNLRRNWFEAEYVANAGDALSLIMDMLPQSALVGMGDSLTLNELGVIDASKRSASRRPDGGKPTVAASHRSRCIVGPAFLFLGRKQDIGLHTHTPFPRATPEAGNSCVPHTQQAGNMPPITSRV